MKLRWLALALLLCGAPVRAGETLPHFRLATTLDPPAQTLDARATVDVPEALAGQAVEFLLAAPLTIVESQPRAEALGADASAGFVGINGSSSAITGSGRAARYRVRLGPGQRSFTLRYRGRVDFGFDTPAQEYARGFSETAGVIKDEGVYLAGSTLWYPHLGETLFTFELTAQAPPGWQLVSPGAGSAGDGQGRASWRSTTPIDELHIVGGPLVRYARSSGAVTAEVYLHSSDDALAARYLEATARNLEMYRTLIGPYPYGKFALVENFWETGYGMPSFTLLGPQIIRFPFILTSSYPHEILHNWWGNGVFVDYARGNWCEGLTAYLADHLYKEQVGQGAEYRRDTLKKYRDFVREARDFPLTEFRSRHSPATEAVGYGKALMTFHMLRRRVGDAAYTRGLQRFYREQRGKRASFADLATAHGAAAQQELGPWFAQWVQRAGAPDLRVRDLRVRRQQRGFVVTGSIEQAQRDEPFPLEVPLVLRTGDGVIMQTIASSARSTRFSITASSAPQALEIDPEFDLFRLLDARETAPSLGQIFGEPQILAVAPASASPQQLEAYRAMVAFWSAGDAQKIDLKRDDEIAALPADRAAWIFGADNAYAAKFFRSDAALGLTVAADQLVLPTGRMPLAGHSAVVVRRHPGNAGKVIAWVVTDAVAAPGLARKLPHYGKYSYLGFEGAEPANTIKGEWSTVDSPLHVGLRAASERSVSLAPARYPPRKPLAMLPAVFEEASMLAHVRWLADPAREGRGLGSAGLEAAGAYVAEQLAKAGVRPAGDDGGWFQAFSFTPAGAQQTLASRNVVGLLPGTNPAFAGQAVVLSAHYDHLGRSGPGVRVNEVGQVHPGADDNASGIAVLLELARTLGAAGGAPRTVIFAGFSAEESGLIGSRHFVAQAASTGKPVALSGVRAVVNLDTVGRLGNGELNAIGTGTASEWVHVFRGIGFTTGVSTRSIPGAIQSSDQQSFTERGVPAVQLFTGAHLDYHRPTDTADKVDGPGLVKVAMVAREAIEYLAARPEPLSVTIAPETAAPSASANAPAATRRVSLGIVPDYAFAGPGVRAESVVPQSPAARAGVTSGDVLLELDGKPLKDLAALADVLRGLAPGSEVGARIQRAGAAQELRIRLVER